VSLYDKDNCHFTGFVYTDSDCVRGEGYLIDSFWGRSTIQPLGFHPKGVNRKRAVNRYGEKYSKFRAATTYIQSVRPEFTTIEKYDQMYNALQVSRDAKSKTAAEEKASKIAAEEKAAPSKRITDFFARKSEDEVKVAPTKKAKLDDYFATRESDVEEEAESELFLSTLSVRELKRRLNERGVAHGDCVEKSDLVDKLISIRGIASNSRADNRPDSTFDEKNVAAGMKRTEEEALNTEMFPEQIDVLTESEYGTDLNLMLSSMGMKKLTAKQYQSIRKRERARKRADGEDVPTYKFGAPVTLAREDRATCGARACQTPGCKKQIQTWMDGKGWCYICCPSDIKNENFACSHIDKLGVRCTKRKRFDGLCTKHCPDDHPEKVENRRRIMNVKQRKEKARI